MNRRTRRPLHWLVAALALVASGCWSHVEDYCASCVVVPRAQPEAPLVPAGTHTVAVLVHGAFGFGDEWPAVVESLRGAPGFYFFAYTWPGPWRDPPGSAVALAHAIQAVIDRAPPSVSEVMVLAHSAGGLMANFAARTLRVPPGRHVTVALLDPALGINVAPPAYAEAVDTPLGLALSSEQPAYPPVPPGVTMTAYLARDPAPAPSTPRSLDATDVPRVFVGNIGHNPMVAHVCLPLLDARRIALRPR